ncbi:MAG: cyclase family protein [Candidatus Thermoplasmatota archaeon]|nr:cyclase family protein [Candidatus Thermoplasmatota archaeon]MCL5437889.1 cyclase family protein [Candidatus Thermoplasmatota archaeon]
MKIIDISMEISSSIITYPGNPSPVIHQYARIPEQATNESTISIGSHTGTHVDAGLHVLRDGYDSGMIPLENMYGRCRVLDLTRAGSEIEREHLKSLDIKKGEIILLKTENSLKQYETFRNDFAHVARSGAEFLVECGIRTIGIDYLSVKKFNADNDVHELLISNMTVYEGLNLVEVSPGSYTFIAFPLRIKCDASPARAILIEE